MLAPDGFEARLAQANYYVRGSGQPTFLPDAERLLKKLHGEQPRDVRVLHMLAVIYRAQQRDTEALETFAQLEALLGGPNLGLTTKAWMFYWRGRYPEAEETIDRALVLEPTTLHNLVLKLIVLLHWHGDLERARDFVQAMPPSARLEDWGASFTAEVYAWRREPAQELDAIEAVPREWLSSAAYSGPKALLTGAIRQRLNRAEAARADFQRASSLLESRLASAANDPLLLFLKAVALDKLGERPAAVRAYQLATEAAGTNGVRGWSAGSGGAGNSDMTVSFRTDDTAGLLAELESAALPLAVLRLDPELDRLREEPRFKALLERVAADPRSHPQPKK